MANAWRQTFFAQPRRPLVKGLMIPKRRVANSCQLVGQRTRDPVMTGSALHGHSPLPQRAERLSLGLRRGRCAQHASGPVNEQRAQVSIPPIGDAVQVLARARAVLLGRDAEPAGNVRGIVEVADVARGDGTWPVNLEDLPTG